MRLGYEPYLEPQDTAWLEDPEIKAAKAAKALENANKQVSSPERDCGRGFRVWDFGLMSVGRGELLLDSEFPSCPQGWRILRSRPRRLPRPSKTLTNRLSLPHVIGVEDLGFEV